MALGLVGCLAVVAGEAWLGSARAQDPRTLRGHELAQYDELDEPRFVERSSHRGWEVHSGHFVVVSMHDPDEARRVAARSEATWAAFGELADQWSEVHHQPQFGRGAVSVWIVDHPRADGRTTWGANDAAEVYLTRDVVASVAVESESGGPPGPPPLEQLAAAQFIRVARWEARLPDWLQAGLARYVAEEVSRPAGALDPFAAPAAEGAVAESSTVSARSPAKVLVGGREIATRPWPSQSPAVSRGNVVLLTPTRPRSVTLTSAEDSPAGNPDPDAASTSAWVRYWLESSDGRHAEELIDWLRQATATAGPATFARELPPPGAADELARWQRDRWADQPIAMLDDLGDAELGPAARELVMAWKLADRFGRAQSPVTGSRVTEFRGGRQVPLAATEPGPEPIDVDELRDRLLSEDIAPWATVDADGRLLWSRDRQRVAEILGADRTEQLTAGWEDDHPTLARRLPDGRLLISWVDELPSAEATAGAGATRPRIRFRVATPPVGPQPRVLERGQPRAPAGT